MIAKQRTKKSKNRLSSSFFLDPGEPLMMQSWKVQQQSNIFSHFSHHLDKEEGGQAFCLQSPFQPAGDQIAAIERLVHGCDEKNQVLLGVTGSGKTFTMANIIVRTQRPALVLAPNKILAAQLYSEFKNFFPKAAVAYFVSYYDYYQPEAYMPRADTYIAKEATVNADIDRMRHHATRALLERDDVIIVSSVSCLYGLGDVGNYSNMTIRLHVGQNMCMADLCSSLVDMRYTRTNLPPERGQFTTRGNHVDIFPAHHQDRIVRLSLHGAHIANIQEIEGHTGTSLHKISSLRLYPNSHYATPLPTLQQAIITIREEMEQRIEELHRVGKPLIAARIQERTLNDLEHMRSHGSCHGIENYSRHLTGRLPCSPPPTLFEYLPSNTLLFVDESHVTLSQIRGMFRGDFQRKMTLASYGFRLPSCVDNRPLKFEEWDALRPQTIFVSATPGTWEIEQSNHVCVEQIIRPTGLLDPLVKIHAAKTQIQHLLKECEDVVKKKGKILVTVLTKKMAEMLVDFFLKQNIRARYIHADVNTLDRIAMMQDFRKDRFDVLVGINLLREGLDVPECSLVAILDADSQGFLRSRNAIIQTVGRAARHQHGRAILYADQKTLAIEQALSEMQRRRDKQQAYNKKHGIKPKGITKKHGIVVPFLANTFGKEDRTKRNDPEQIHDDNNIFQYKGEHKITRKSSSTKKEKKSPYSRKIDSSEVARLRNIVKTSS